MFTWVKDFRGLEICKGDLIAYPDRKGSQMWMNHAFVETVFPTGVLTVRKSDGKQARILRTDRVAVLGRN